MATSLRALAADAAKLLARKRLRLVLAESCTGGKASAALAEQPGISDWFCGSAVTYREETKAMWLGLSRKALRTHGAVSAEIARAMAQGALKKTSEADVALSITGHLGPGAPHELDGVIFIGVAVRDERTRFTHALKFQLLPRRAPSSDEKARKLRLARQLLASKTLMRVLRSLIESRSANRRARQQSSGARAN